MTTRIDPQAVRDGAVSLDLAAGEIERLNGVVVALRMDLGGLEEERDAARDTLEGFRQEHANAVGERGQRLRKIEELQGLLAEADRCTDEARDSRDEAKAQIAALREALEAQQCALCRNTGRWTPHCFKCDDSGEDHVDCPSAEDCTNKACALRRAALADTDEVAARWFSEEEMRQALIEFAAARNISPDGVEEQIAAAYDVRGVE